MKEIEVKKKNETETKHQFYRSFRIYALVWVCLCKMYILFTIFALCFIRCVLLVCISFLTIELIVSKCHIWSYWPKIFHKPSLYPASKCIHKDESFDSAKSMPSTWNLLPNCAHCAPHCDNVKMKSYTKISTQRKTFSNTIIKRFMCFIKVHRLADGEIQYRLVHKNARHRRRRWWRQKQRQRPSKGNCIVHFVNC